MRIAAVSDLYVLPDGNDKHHLECIKRRVAESHPDVFVIAGDMSDRLGFTVPLGYSRSNLMILHDFVRDALAVLLMYQILL